VYIQRHIEAVLREAVVEKGALCVTGARQAGKSTVLKALFATSHKELTLDDGRLLRLAKERPEGVFVQFPPPVFVDEIQYAPDLFPYVKMHIDSTGEKGAFLLSGSQRYEMMQGMTESLSGRINLIDLYGLSTREIRGEAFREPFLPTADYCERRKPATMRYNEVWDAIWRGFFPEIVANRGSDWARFYSAYVRTYLDRDVSRLKQAGDLMQFEKFMVAMAARTGQLLNIAELSKDVGISQQTAEKWLSVLVSSNIVFLLSPYHNNVLKRLVKAPKAYFMDTGLASYLLGWDNARVLQNGAMAGAVFETFVIGEIVKSWANASGVAPNRSLFYYRDRDGNEIDLLIFRNGTLYPIEIKKHVRCDKGDVAAFRILDKIPNVARGAGCVVCMADDVFPIASDDRAIGAAYL